jgi:5-hydroxyisourate hydrolase-like protein (transthyretin family)
MDSSDGKICCSSCLLEARLLLSANGPYTVTFDTKQFFEKCVSPNKNRSLTCVDLELAISVATQPGRPA